MGEMDGLETARLIRQRPQTEHLPIIFVTAFDRAEIDVSAGYEIGAADFVFKPFQPDALRAKVGVFVDLFHKTEAIRRQGERLRQMEQLEHRRRLEQSERGRLAAEARFENILALAPDGVLALDEEGHLLLFNQGAEEIFGCAAEEVLGGPAARLLPVAAIGEATGPGSIEVVATRRDGSTFPAELSISHLKTGDDLITTVICRDITDRRRNEERERELNRELHERLRMGVDMVAGLAATLNPAEVMERVLRRLVHSVDADQGTLLRVDGKRLVVQESYDLERKTGLRRGTDFGRLPLLERALGEGRPQVNGDLGKVMPARLREWLTNVHQTAALPLRLGDQTGAVILLARRRPKAFGERELETLELIGNVAAVALRNAQLFTQAEAASISKSEFLNMAAHELRTPLSVITGYLSMLADGTLGSPGDAWRRPIDILNIKAAELNKLVDALLLAARMEAGTIHGEPQVVELGRLAREALHRAEARAHLLEADMRLETPDQPVLAEADPNHVGRILDNLINNALTYSAERPWVKVTVVADAGVVVEDRGLGVPEDRRDAIFERFYRVNDPSLPPQPGTGLGLYLSRELAQRYGGTVTLEESTPGLGSRFLLRLSAAAVEGPAGAASAEPVSMSLPAAE